MVGLFNDTINCKGGICYIYDFKLIKGNLMMFASPPRKYVGGNTLGTIYIGRLNLECNDFNVSENDSYCFIAVIFVMRLTTTLTPYK